jgi:putative transposase
VLDEGERDSIAIGVNTSLPAERVVDVLEQVVPWRGQPRAIRLDSGSEPIAERFMSWSAKRAIELRYIQARKLDQNAFTERFNRTYRMEVLNAYVFESLERSERSAQHGC